jgi:hypothetical protein
MVTGYRTTRAPARRGESSPRRHRSVPMALALVLAAALVGCSSGPGEEQMLPEKDLSFPQSTMLERAFEEEHHGTNVDGGRVDRFATLYTAYRAAAGTPFSDVQVWYRQQLEPKGWRVIPMLPAESQIEFVRTTDEFDHEIRVYRPGGSPERYSVSYEIRERP